MRRYKLLPLGVDLGTSRARVALAEHAGDNNVRIRAVTSRDIGEGVKDTPALIATLLEEMIGELGVRERRCVASVGGATTLLRVVRLPKMSWHERVRASRFEAQRLTGGEERLEGSVVRVHGDPSSEGDFAVGVASKDTLRELISTLRLARLKPVAVDHDALALRRALSVPDAIIDIGAERSTLHLYVSNAPYSHHVAVGGAEVSRGIARDLSVDMATAERRKRILGAAGCGVRARNALVAELASVLERARGRSQVTRVALVGNGARLPGLAAELEAVTGAIVELPVPAILETDVYPEDVIRAASPDWTLAAALTTWGARL